LLLSLVAERGRRWLDLRILRRFLWFPIVLNSLVGQVAPVLALLPELLMQLEEQHVKDRLLGFLPMMEGQLTWVSTLLKVKNLLRLLQAGRNLKVLLLVQPLSVVIKGTYLDPLGVVGFPLPSHR
jgi:hypothetical protein